MTLQVTYLDDGIAGSSAFVLHVTTRQGIVFSYRHHRDGDAIIDRDAVRLAIHEKAYCQSYVMTGIVATFTGSALEGIALTLKLDDESINRFVVLRRDSPRYLSKLYSFS